MPETPFDPAQMPVAGTFSEPAAIKAHAEMLNQINVLRSDRDTWRRLCREAQAEVARLEGLDDLREENARLTGELAEIRCELRKHDARDIPITSIEMIRNLTRERDEARAEVARLEGLILGWDNGWMGYPDARMADEPLMAEAKRIRGEKP